MKSIFNVTTLFGAAAVEVNIDQKKPSRWSNIKVAITSAKYNIAAGAFYGHSAYHDLINNSHFRIVPTLFTLAFAGHAIVLARQNISKLRHRALFSTNDI